MNGRWFLLSVHVFATNGRFPSEGRLLTKAVFQQRSSSTEGHLPPKAVFHRRSSSTQGCLPQKAVFHRRPSFTYHNTLVDLIFVKTVNIPNLSLLPCLEVASPIKVVFHRRSSSTEADVLCEKVVTEKKLWKYWSTNVVASWTPGWQTTDTLIARANFVEFSISFVLSDHLLSKSLVRPPLLTCLRNIWTPPDAYLCAY